MLSPALDGFNCQLINKLQPQLLWMHSREVLIILFYIAPQLSDCNLMDKKRAIQGFVQLILSQARTFEVEKEQTNCRHDECGSTNVL